MSDIAPVYDSYTDPAPALECDPETAEPISTANGSGGAFPQGGAGAGFPPVMAEHRRRCGAAIEKEWPGHRVVLSRRSCKAYPLKGYDHCRHHLTFQEWERYTAHRWK